MRNNVFLPTIILVVLSSLYLTLSYNKLFVSLSSPTSPNSLRNSNTSTDRDDTDLAETLKRRGEGKAAVVIIRVEPEDESSEPKYLLQRKSADYPVSTFRKALCLYGGNVEVQDETPRETLLRELTEELPTDFVEKVVEPSLKFLYYALHQFTSELLEKPPNNDYSFVCALYEARISWEDFSLYYDKRVIKDTEGGHVLMTQSELIETADNYAWGYDSTMTNYFGAKVNHFVKGATVIDVGLDPHIEDGGLGFSWKPTSS